MNAPNATQFVFDAHSGMSLDTIRERYRKGIYGKLHPHHMQGWLTMAGFRIERNHHG